MYKLLIDTWDKAFNYILKGGIIEDALDSIFEDLDSILEVAALVLPLPAACRPLRGWECQRNIAMRTMAR